MKISSKKKLLPLSLSFLIFSQSICLAAQIDVDRWRVNPGASEEVTGQDGVCRKVTNAGAQAIFIPLRAAQWQSFLAHPPTGVSLTACCTDTCASLGYTCGTHTICGATVDCGGPCCTSECSAGQTSCSGGYIQNCTRAADGCYYWVAGAPCYCGCSGGACIMNCTLCTCPPDAICDTNGIHFIAMGMGGWINGNCTMPDGTHGCNQQVINNALLNVDCSTW